MKMRSDTLGEGEKAKMKNLMKRIPMMTMTVFQMKTKRDAVPILVLWM